MPSGNLGFNPFAGSKDLVSASFRLQNTPEAIDSLNNSFKVFSKAQQNEQIRLKQEDRNLKLNSLRGLYMQAYDNQDFADKSAASMFSRIEGAKDKDSINKIYQELDTLREKAEDNKYLFDVAEIGDTFLNWMGRTNPLGMDRPDALKTTKEGLLRKTNEDLTDVNKWLTPSDLLGNIKNHISQVDYKNFGVNLLKSFGSPEELNSKLKKALASPTPQFALDDLIDLKLKDNFITKGSDFYREGPEAKAFQKDAINALKNPDDLTKKYFKYDLENETLGSLKASIATELTNLIGQPETPENERLKASYRQSLELIDKRQKDNSKIYGVNQYEEESRIGSKGRGGTMNSTLSGVVDLTNFFSRDDFEGTIYKRALYQPQIQSYDSKGRPVMSNQFMYEKADGSVGFNFGAIPEAGFHMFAQMLPILATGSLVGGIVGAAAESARLGAVGRAAAQLEKSYLDLNKVAALPESVPLIGGELRIADRVATLASVTVNTLPTMLAEEKKWGGNYVKRATAKAIVEGVTEGVGFPDIGVLRFKRFQADLATSAKRAAGVELKFSDNARNFLNSTGQFTKMALKQNAVEAFEEELALLGNALVENSIMPEEYAGRDKTEVTGEALLDTFVESFAAGAIYSGIMTGFQGIASGNKTHVQNQADWEAANNPELFKAKLKQLNEKGQLSDQQYSQAVLEVNRKSQILNGLFGFNNIRDAKTLLEDKDEQYKYFINHLRADELVSIDYDQLTDSEKEIFASRKIADKISTKGRDRMTEIRKELVELYKSPSEDTKSNDDKATELLKEYNTIRRANIKTLNKKELTPQEERVLKEKGILGEKDFEYTQADLEDELSKINTEILATQKRIEKYANLSQEEKANVISKAYDEKIADLNSITDPQELVDSRLNVQRDLDYLKLKGNYKDKAEIANRERLLDAYGNRFDELVNTRDDNGRNSLEQSIENIDYDSLESSLDLYGISTLRNQIDSNKDFIDSDMAEVAEDNLANSQVRVLTQLMTADPETRLNALGVFLDKVAPINASYAYNVENVNKYFPGVNFTVEELDAAREAFIDRRASIKAMKVVDETPASEEVTEQEKEDVQDFNSSLPTEEEKAAPTQESGKSVKTDKFNKGYINTLNNFKQKYPTDYKNRFVEFLINAMGAKFGRNSNEFKQLTSLIQDFASNKINEGQFNSALKPFEDVLQKDIAARKKNNISFKTAQDKLDSLDYLKYQITRFVREEGGITPTVETLTAKAATPVATTASTDKVLNNQVLNNFPEVDSRNKKLDTQAAIRLNQLIDLATPLRSNALEFDRDNQKRTDPANIRNVKAIDSIAGQPLQIRIQSRKGIVMMFIAMSNPEKSEADIAADMTTIEALFENSNFTEKEWDALTQEQQDEVLKPLHDLLGKEFFDRGALRYFITNKGDGFTVNSAVSMTSSSAEDGSLNLFDGYPLLLDFPKEDRVSERIVKDFEKLGGSLQELAASRQEAIDLVTRLKSYLSENTSAFVDADYSVSEGVVLKSAEQKKASELQNEVVDKAKVSDFEIADQIGQEIFGKRYNFRLGRIYFNNQENPVVLSNTPIAAEEAEAIAELVYSENLPKEFPDQKSLENYLLSLINVIDKKNRIHFFPNNNFPSKTDKVQYPLNVVFTQYKDGKPVNTKLTKEEFIRFLKQSFYKADRTMLQSGAPMMRISLVDGKPTVTKQSYVEYIKDTHTFPVTAAGELLSPVNKVVYPNVDQIKENTIGILPKVQPQTPPVAPSPEVKPTPKPTPEVSTPSTSNKVDEFIVMPYGNAVNYAKTSQSAQAIKVYSAFVNLITPEIYNQAVQIIKDSPEKVTYQIVKRQVSGKGESSTTLDIQVVPYSPETEGDFILATITGIPGTKAIPIIMVRKEEGIGGLKFREDALLVVRGTSSSDFKAMTKEEYINPTNVPQSKASSLAERLNNSERLGEMMDEKDTKEANEAKEECQGKPADSNPASIVRDQIKKKPKL